MTDDRFTPIILAAGRGSRMGGPKALLEIEGRTALERCVATCRAAATRLASVADTASSITPPIIVCGHGAAHVGERFALEPDLVLVLNEDPDRGQTSSVQTGLAALPPVAAGFFIFPVDHPLVADDDLVALVRAATETADALIVRPSHGGRAGHPVLIRRALCGEILALGADEPLRGVIRTHADRTLFVTRPTAGILGDLDTPADLARAVESLRGRAPDRGDG